MWEKERKRSPARMSLKKNDRHTFCRIMGERKEERERERTIWNTPLLRSRERLILFWKLGLAWPWQTRHLKIVYDDPLISLVCAPLLSYSLSGSYRRQEGRTMVSLYQYYSPLSLFRPLIGLLSVEGNQARVGLLSKYARCFKRFSPTTIINLARFKNTASHVPKFEMSL